MPALFFCLNKAGLWGSPGSQKPVQQNSNYDMKIYSYK